MPEGDTVWLTAQRLNAALGEQPLLRADLRVPKLATVDLAGRRVLEVVARGKHLLARVEGELTLHSHLRMDGAWHLYGPGERWRGGAPHQVRAVLETEARTAVGYRLPVLELLPTPEEARVVGHLGPDLLGPGWDPVRALAALVAVPERPVGEALLDQRNLAGIGNVYAAELCFLRGVTPWTPFGEVRAPEKLVVLARRLLEANKARPGHATTGDTRRGRTHWVYGREHQPCLRCGTTIRSARHGREEESRVAYWCPRCQQGPVPGRQLTSGAVPRPGETPGTPPVSPVPARSRTGAEPAPGPSQQLTSPAVPRPGETPGTPPVSPVPARSRIGAGPAPESGRQLTSATVPRPAGPAGTRTACTGISPRLQPPATIMLGQAAPPPAPERRSSRRSAHAHSAPPSRARRIRRCRYGRRRPRGRRRSVRWAARGPARARTAPREGAPRTASGSRMAPQTFSAWNIQ